MTDLFDTHVHADLLRGAGGLDGAMARARSAGVGRWLVMGGNAASNRFAVACAAAHPERMACAVGYDRDAAGAGFDRAALEAWLDSGAPARPVAIGEIGLDFHYRPETAERQAALFAEQLDVARRRRCPVAVHSREAEERTLDLLRRHARGWPGPADRIGVIHCFTGSPAFARELVALGFHLSFSGIVTFANAGPLREIAAWVPPERLLAETDSPFLAPVPRRGTPNEPAFLADVLRGLADARGASAEAIAELTAANARRLFGWPAAGP